MKTVRCTGVALIAGYVIVCPPPHIPDDRWIVELDLGHSYIVHVCGISAEACSLVGEGGCTILLPDYAPVNAIDALREHEIAHCYGWAHPKD